MRIARAATSLAVASLAVTGAQFGAGAAAHADVITVSQSPLRDGWDQNEPGLSPSVVTSGKFGQLFATPVDGQVFAQALVVDHPGSGLAAPSTSVIVGTENDSVYSLDGASGAVLWKTSVGTPWAAYVASCGDVTPRIGITSTPVYDKATGTVYVVADDTKGNPGTTTPEFDVVALSERDGTVKWRKAIPQHPVNDPAMTFQPQFQRQRAGLLLAGNGWLYLAFGSVCDKGTYAGYVAGVDTASQGAAETLWTDESGTTSPDPEAGIWQSGGGLVQMPGNPDSFYLATGNGISPAPWSEGSAFPAQNNAQLGDSVVRLDIQPDGSLQARDFFSPANAPTLAATDRDLGSGGVVGLPFGTSAYPRLLVQAGKDGRVLLLNADSLGGRNATTDHAVNVSGPYGGQWGHPAAFASSAGGYVYYTGTGYGAADYLRVLRLTGASNDPALTEVGNSAAQFGYSSGSPVVTSTGTDPATAVVWEVNAADTFGTNGTLEAFAAIPRGGIVPEIWSAPIGAAAKFTVAATDSGRVYLGTRGDSGTGAGTVPGVVFGFGVKGGTPPFAGAQQATLPDAGVNGAASAKSVTLTATENVTVTGIALDPASAPAFALGTVSVNGTAVGGPVSAASPLSLTPGQALTIPVTFTPTATGLANGQLQLTTNVTSFTTVSVPLAATGTAPGLSADPATLDFGANGSGNANDPNTGPVPVGSSEQFQTDITNTSTVPVTIASVTTTSPFSVTGVRKGDTLNPGVSAAATVTYTPTTVTGADSGSLRVGYANADGTSPGTTSVTLSGVSEAGKGTLSASAAAASFGPVQLGQTASTSVNFTNTGNLPLTVTKFSAPGVPFGTPVPVTTGLSINAGSEITLPVTFTPQSGGTCTGTYQITTTDGRNPATTMTITASGTGQPAASGVAVPGPGGGWRLNGTARMTGTTLALTPAANNAAGSAAYYQPLATSGLRATFRAQLTGGSGGDGMTFALVSPGDTTSALGHGGPLLGFGGLHGVAVVLGTHKDAGFPSANFVGIATGTTGSGTSARLALRATSSGVPNLRSGSHLIAVAVSGSGSARTITVGVDGTQYLKTTLTLPATALPVFTAGTGAATAEQSLASGVALASAAGAVPPPGGGWSYNGSALMSGSDTDLTTIAANQAGTVIYPRAVATAATSTLTAQFEMQIGGGTGANGATFALLSPTTSARAVGTSGGGLGLGNLTGVAVAFSTYPSLGLASSNFVALVRAKGASGLWLGVARIPVGQLRSGIHTVKVTLASGRLVVYLDGGLVISTRLPTLPATSLLAFTAGSGAKTDVHAIRNVTVAASGW